MDLFFDVISSVTRFGNISPPGKLLKLFRNVLRVI